MGGGQARCLAPPHCTGRPRGTISLLIALRLRHPGLDQETPSSALGTLRSAGRWDKAEEASYCVSPEEGGCCGSRQPVVMNASFPAGRPPPAPPCVGPCPAPTKAAQTRAAEVLSVPGAPPHPADTHTAPDHWWVSLPGDCLLLTQLCWLGPALFSFV